MFGVDGWEGVGSGSFGGVGVDFVGAAGGADGSVLAGFVAEGVAEGFDGVGVGDLEAADVELVVDFGEGGGAAEEFEDVEAGGAKWAAPELGGVGGEGWDVGVGAGVGGAAAVLPGVGGEQVVVEVVEFGGGAVALFGDAGEFGVEGGEFVFEFVGSVSGGGDFGVLGVPAAGVES